MDLRAAVQPSWELPILGPTALDREENRGRGMEGAGAEPSTSNGAPIFLQDYARRKSQDFAGGLRSTDRWPSHKSMACVRWQKLKSHARDVARSRRALKRIGSLPPLVLLTTSVAKGSLSNQLSMLNKLSREDWSPKVCGSRAFPRHRRCRPCTAPLP